MHHSQWSIGDHCAHRLHVLNEFLQPAIRIAQIVGGRFVTEQIENAVHRFDRVAQIRWEINVPFVGGRGGCVHGVVCVRNQKWD